MRLEREHLLPLAAEGFLLAAIHFPSVNGSRCARVLANFYSVPAQVGRVVQARVYAAEVELWHEGKSIARHDRCFSRQKKVLDLEHYLDVLSKEPGALAGSSPYRLADIRAVVQRIDIRPTNVAIVLGLGARGARVFEPIVVTLSRA
jgi:hypothetical protein